MKEELVTPKKDYKTEYLFKKGITYLSTPLELDRMKIKFETGANICLSNNSYIRISDSNVIFMGNEKIPITISECNKGSKINSNLNGGVIIENSLIEVNHLILSGLSYPKIPLRKLYGGLNIIDSKLNIEQLEVYNALSEDALNFINSEVNAKFISISQSESDGLDSDFSDLNIEKITCNNIGNDCLDISYSNSNVTDLKANSIGDKAISLGEGSKLSIKNVLVKNSEIGIVGKDASSLDVDSYRFNNVSLPLAAFIKKPEFDAPTLIINKVKPTLNENYLVGKEVKLYVNGKNLTSNLTSQQVKEKLYGNQYGKKTIR